MKMIKNLRKKGLLDERRLKTEHKYHSKKPDSKLKNESGFLVRYFDAFEMTI